MPKRLKKSPLEPAAYFFGPQTVATSLITDHREDHAPRIKPKLVREVCGLSPALNKDRDDAPRRSRNPPMGMRFSPFVLVLVDVVDVGVGGNARVLPDVSRPAEFEGGSRAREARTGEREKEKEKTRHRP